MTEEPMTEDAPAENNAGGEAEAGGAPIDKTVAESPWESRIFDPEKPGKFAEKWQELLPDDLEDAKHMLAGYPDLKTVLRSLKDNKTKAREKAGVKPLTAESTPEQIKAYRQEMGIPDTPYEFPKPEKLPEGVDWPEERVKGFGKWAQERNWTPAQAKEAIDKHIEFLAEDRQAISAAEQKAFEANLAAEKEYLRTTYGGKLGSAVQNAQRIALHYAIPVEIADPDSPKFGGATMLRMMNDLADALPESRIPSITAVANMTPEREYLAITRDKSHPMHALWAKGDKFTVERVNELRRQAVAASGGSIAGR